MTPTEIERLARLEQHIAQHDIEMRDMKADVAKIMEMLGNYWPRGVAFLLGGCGTVIGILVTLIGIMAKS